MDRNETIREIRNALKRRSQQRWSVTGGRGTAYCWINVTANKADHSMTEDERTELGRLLGLPPVHFQGYSIPAGNDFYQEAIDRANGRTPSIVGKPYWD